MEAVHGDERPTKLRKLSHDAEDQNSSTIVGSPPDTSLQNAQPDGSNNSNDAPAPESAPTVAADEDDKPMSKNQLKKLRRKEHWEAGRDDRRAKRRDKMKEKKIRKREEKLEARKNADPERLKELTARPPPRKRIRLPVAIVLDCGFDDLMMEKERISLGSQVTRSYSDNSRALYSSHLYVSSWGGELKHRFETVIHGTYRNWKGVTFTDQDFVEASARALEAMRGPKGGTMAGMFTRYAEPPESDRGTTEDGHGQEAETATEPNTKDNEQVATKVDKPDPEKGEIVYLTSDSPDTLTTLEPYNTYIVGGIVDKNRHKGLCYKKALDAAQRTGKPIRTAKLPIGEYMQMISRYVLATNHVVEIMLKWLECGDWGEAFMSVIPTRKGGTLKSTNGSEKGANVSDHLAHNGEAGGDEDSDNDDDVEVELQPDRMSDEDAAEPQIAD